MRCFPQTLSRSPWVEWLVFLACFTLKPGEGWYYYLLIFFLPAPSREFNTSWTEKKQTNKQTNVENSLSNLMTCPWSSGVQYNLQNKILNLSHFFPPNIELPSLFLRNSLYVWSFKILIRKHTTSSILILAIMKQSDKSGMWDIP